MTCERYRGSIEAFVDGECRPEEAQSLREHLHVCPACRARAEQLSALQELVHRLQSTETAPPDLWHRIERRLGQARPAPPVTPRRFFGAGTRRLLAATFVTLVLAAAGMQALRHQAPVEQAVISKTVEDFVTFRLSQRPFDLASDDPGVVRAWFAGKIRFELPPMKKSVAGYELVGSRLCWLLDQRLGAFSYQAGDRMMTLYVMHGGEMELSGGSFETALGTVAARRRVDGYGGLVWRRGELMFSLVSSASDEEMTAFAAALVGGGDAAARARDGFVAVAAGARGNIRIFRGEIG